MFSFRIVPRDWLDGKCTGGEEDGLALPWSSLRERIMQSPVTACLIFILPGLTKSQSSFTRRVRPESQKEREILSEMCLMQSGGENVNITFNKWTIHYAGKAKEIVDDI